jgi:protein TonB
MTQPATLPADFGEWDSGDSAAEQPASPNQFPAYPVATPKPAAKAATARVAVPVSGRTPSAPARPPAAAYIQAAPRPQAASGEVKQESEGKSKKTGLFLVLGTVVVLAVAGTLGYSKLRARPVQPTSSVTQQTAATSPTQLKPDASTALNPASQAANTNSTTAANAAETTEPERPMRAESAMNHQLNAPSRIPHDLKMLAGRDAPPLSSFGASAEGLGGGAPGSVFSGQSGPKVKVEASRKVNISAGVAVGLLVQKTAPVYPPIAKTARVSGTVVIQATISKAGTVENLRVVNGPTMLRQAALDAVKSWRYRPYLLDGSPTEVETTVNVVFSQGN